ncbi:hypothetical protein E4U44_007699 [Claviceps purpurea]|nr:hypothetical protein E4U44_007699 [Claviceps purpurea]
MSGAKSSQTLSFDPEAPKRAFYGSVISAEEFFQLYGVPGTERCPSLAPAAPRWGGIPGLEES